MKESEARMEKIPSTMVLHKHVDGPDTILATMLGPLAKNPLKKWLGVTEEGNTKKRLKIADGYMSQCLIYGQI